MIRKIVSLVFVSVFLLSAMVGVRAQGVHDVAVVKVTAKPANKVGYTGASAVYPMGQWYVNVTVTVENQGSEAENFTVTTYYDSSAIETKNVTNLAPGTNTTITFTWKTPGVTPCPYNVTAMKYVPYTISAEASVVPGEIDTDDNTLIDGTVVVRFPGDANGDGWVKGDDMGFVGWYWYEVRGYVWQPDTNGDGHIRGDDLGVPGYYWFQHTTLVT